MSVVDDKGNKRVACGAALVLQHRGDNRVLLLKRTGAHGEGTWGLPGGWVNPREDPAEAAKREAWEEIGVTVRNVDFLGYTHDLHPEGVEDVCLYFHTYAWEGNPRVAYPARVSRVDWFELDLLPHPLFFPLTQALDKRLFATLAR